jgi:hypothetical protein
MAHYLSSQDLRQKVNLSRRQMARLSKGIPGAERLDGYHWKFKSGRLLDAWVRAKQVAVLSRKSKMKRADSVPKRQGYTLTVSDLCIQSTRNLQEIVAMIEADQPIARWSKVRKEAISTAFDGLLDQLVRLTDQYAEMKKL